MPTIVYKLFSIVFWLFIISMMVSPTKVQTNCLIKNVHIFHSMARARADLNKFESFMTNTTAIGFLLCLFICKKMYLSGQQSVSMESERGNFN